MEKKIFEQLDKDCKQIVLEDVEIAFNKFEHFKDKDGVYDLRDADMTNIIDIFKLLKENDKVKIEPKSTTPT